MLGLNRRNCFCLLAMLIAFVLCVTGCAKDKKSSETANIPSIPDKLTLNKDDVPVLRVYNTETESVDEMDVESYIMGVVAGEMKNNWPIEALKAQAILARTFTMKFISDKDSSYENAYISTDIHEAQAYNADDINDRIREAVNETRGQVMIHNGDFTHAWFHAHSGGTTEFPTKALDYKEDPDYLSVVKYRESDKAPANVQNWTAEFSNEQIIQACRKTGLNIESLESFEIGEKGTSGRAASFFVNGKSISAPTFRLQIGASELKSTLIDDIALADNSVHFIGRGFGHGVGMSQWGAYQMAEEGKTAEEIIRKYYTGVDLVELW